VLLAANIAEERFPTVENGESVRLSTIGTNGWAAAADRPAIVPQIEQARDDLRFALGQSRREPPRGQPVASGRIR
jgi:hypothetical protein